MNLDNIKSVAINDKPPIIYLSCEGSLDDHGLEFNLYFENHCKGEAAVAEEINSLGLKSLLGETKDHGIKLAFVDVNGDAD